VTILHRYWFKFSLLKPYSDLGLGCGVTAYNLDDAVAVLEQAVFADGRSYDVASVVEDVDVSTLDPKHVIPNMNPPIWRGVWFPKGYYLPVR